MVVGFVSTDMDTNSKIQWKTNKKQFKI